MTIEYKDSKRIVALSSDALVAHLKFNDDVTDSAGSNNGTVTGTTTYVTGKVGKGISLNGSSYVTLANESNFDFEHTNPFSITFWIKMNSGSDGGTYYVAAKQNAGGGQVGLGLLLLSNGELRFGFDTASGNHRITSSNSVVTVSSGWTHVSITYDGSSNLSGCKIYINGTLDVTGSSSSITSTVLNNYAFVWGASSDGSLDTPATYDDTRIYSRELDQSEVSVIYNGGTGTEGDLKPTNVQDNSLLVEKDTARRYWCNNPPSVTNQDIEWSSGNNVTISGNTLTATAGSWSCIARSVQTISPSRGGGTVIGKHSLSYGMLGFSKDPYWTSGNTFANGDYMIYHDEVYELGSGKSGSSFTGADNDTLYKITMDTNGLVKYYADTGSGYTEVYESTVTAGASDEYYVLGVPDGSGSTVSDITITGKLPTTWNLTPTYEDDFSSYADQAAADAAWVSNDTADFRVNITNDNFAFDSKVTSTTNTGAYYDLGTALSDTAWVVDFKMVISTLTLYSSGSVGAATYITMNNSGTGGAIGGTVDAIGFYMSSTASGGRFEMTKADGGALNIGGGTLTTINATGTYYVRIIRLSPTSMRLELYSDPERRQLIEGKTRTDVASTTTGLQYFRIQDNQSSAGTGTGQQIGTIDDIKIYNGVTTPN